MRKQSILNKSPYTQKTARSLRMPDTLPLFRDHKKACLKWPKDVKRNNEALSVKNKDHVDFRKHNSKTAKHKIKM